MKKIFLVAVLIVAAFFVAVAASVVFAQGTNSTSEAPPQVAINWQTLSEVGEAAPIALVIAFLSSMAGYLSATPPENFSLAKFLYTALISAIVSFLTLYAHWSYATVETWLANGFITWYIWKASNIIAQFIISRFSKAAATVTAQATGPAK
jgi:opacity protein-like surface antigen